MGGCVDSGVGGEVDGADIWRGGAWGGLGGGGACAGVCGGCACAGGGDFEPAG